MMNKRISAFLLAALMIMALVPSVAFAEGTVAAKIGTTEYDTIAKAVAAAQPGDTIEIMAGTYGATSLGLRDNVTVVGAVDSDGNNLVKLTGKLSISGNGVTVKNISVDAGGNSAMAISGNGTIDHVNLKGGNGARYCYAHNGTVTFQNCVVEGDVYGIHFDGGNGDNSKVVIKNCMVTGWTSFGRAVETVEIINTSFGKGNYNYIRCYQPVEMDSCTFNEDMTIDITDDVTGDVNITNCVVEGGGSVKDILSEEDQERDSITVIDPPAPVYGGPVMNWVKVNAADNGVVKSGPLAASAGATITLYPKAAEGFVLDTVEVLDKDGNAVTLDGLKFQVPLGGVTVNATFKAAQ